MTIRQAIHWAKELLKQNSSSPRLDAEMILSSILNCDSAFLIAHDDQKLSQEQEENYQKLITERLKGMPVSYLLGKKEFYGLEFQVEEGVLVPRPDTETLVEMTLLFLSGSPSTVSQEEETPLFQQINMNEVGMLIDVGTGSGCIPIAVLKNHLPLRALGFEISPKALKIAQKNAHQLGVEGRLDLIESNLLSQFSEDLLRNQKWILTANLPYIPRDWPKHFSTKFEPDLALFGGENGVDLYRRLATEIEAIFNKPLALFFECFTFQVPKIEAFLPSYELVETKGMTGEACGIRLDLKQ